MGVSRQTIANNIYSENRRNTKRSRKFNGHLSEEVLEIELPDPTPFQDLDGEEWRPIKDFEDYEVSNYGRVRHGEYLKKPTPSNDYLHLGLTKDGKTYTKLVHRLVAEAFIPNPDDKPQVNHIDEDKSNNHVSNLE